MNNYSTVPTPFQGAAGPAMGCGGVARRVQSSTSPVPSPGGLSPAHIRPQALKCVPHFENTPMARSGHATFYDGGTLVEVGKGRILLGQRGGGLRGAIKNYSRASRRRLMRTMGKIDTRQIPVFVTLTYPAEYPQASITWKNHLNAFDRRLRRRFPRAAFGWKLEPQRRGAPHFHLLVWNVDYCLLKLWAGRAWYEVVKSGDAKHLRAGVRVEQIRSWRGVKSYAAKYLGKVQELPEGWEAPGRIWGFRHSEDIPWAAAVRLHVTDRQAARLMRCLRRYAHLRMRASTPSMACFVGDASFWLERADGLLGSPF